MDKGREAIRMLLRIDSGIALHSREILAILRSHGWHHESDVVKGKLLCETTDSHCPSINKGCEGCKECPFNRHATIKDIITGGE